MKITHIHEDWGSIITLDSPEEFFNYDADYWRTMSYDRKLIVFKQVKFTTTDYAKFSLRFGQPWTPEEYRYSREVVEIVEDGLCVSPFSNANTRLIGNEEMPWHSDIPNRSIKPFPFRSLWITENPNPKISGRTKWMNLEKAMDYLTPEMRELLPRVQILQQSWYEPGTDQQEFNLLKIHPVTGKESLRLNYYNWLKLKTAWITGVKIDGVLQKDCRLVKEWLEYLEKIPGLTYQHVWDTYDIALYDNWTFVHGRTKLLLNSKDPIRKFYRININHLNDNEWATYKINL
jgi:alpha-ketoglutarate-dependent taurine dioxygenase